MSDCLRQAGGHNPGLYPEHDKLRAVRDESQTIGEFLAWLSRNNIALCKWRKEWHNGEPKWVDRAGRRTSIADHDCQLNPAYEGWGEGYYEVGRTIEGWLAVYFGIDLAALESEKRQMIDALREMNRP